MTLSLSPALDFIKLKSCPYPRSIGKHHFRTSLKFICVAISFLTLSHNGAGQAAFATGGTGLYRNDILWLNWGGGTYGTDGVNLNVGDFTTATINIGVSPLVVTATITSITAVSGSGNLRTYRSGDYGPDALNLLYNIGGTGPANQLIYGLCNNNYFLHLQVGIQLTATYNGGPYDLTGLVTADAETDGLTEGFSVSADGHWSILETYRSPGCTSNYYATIAPYGGTGEALTLATPDAQCPQGPIGVAYVAFNPTSYLGADRHIDLLADINYTAYSGVSALAFGLINSVDHGDDPGGFGDAAHFYRQTFSDNLIIGTTNLFDPSFTLAARTTPQLCLGLKEDSELNPDPGNSTANSDDATGINDEDGVASFPALPGSGTTVVVPTYPVNIYVTNNTGAPATLYGWLDWNNDGIFDFTEAKMISIPNGTNGIVPFTWNGRTLVGTSNAGTYVRFRIADAGALSAATYSSDNPLNHSTPLIGEVEDYYIPFALLTPVAMTSFTATKALGEQRTILDWQTASEQNSDQFIIERSTDASGWSEVGRVKAAGNSSSPRFYSYTDNKPFSGTNYYRLRQMDIDGKTTYSETKLVNFTNNTRTTILPNPVSNTLYITDLPANAQLRLISADGKMLMHRDAQQGSESINMNGYMRGLYILQVLDKTSGRLLSAFKVTKE